MIKKKFQYRKPKIITKTIYYKLFYDIELFSTDEGLLLADQPGHCNGLCMQCGSGCWMCSGRSGHCP